MPAAPAGGAGGRAPAAGAEAAAPEDGGTEAGGTAAAAGAAVAAEAVAFGLTIDFSATIARARSTSVEFWSESDPRRVSMLTCARSSGSPYGVSFSLS